MPRPPEFDRQVALRQAMNLFWMQGYDATSVHDLGVALGLKPGSLYNAFKDKRSLFLEVLDYYAETEREAAERFFHGPHTGKQAIRRFFELVVQGDVQDPHRKGCLLLNSAAELAARDPDVVSKAAANRARLVLFIRDAVVQGQRSGEIDPHRDAEVLATFLVNGLFGLRLTAKMLNDYAALMTIVDTMLRSLG